MTLMVRSIRGKDRGGRVVARLPSTVGDTKMMTSGITRRGIAAAADLRADQCRIFF